MESYLPFLWLAIGVFVVTSFVQLIFPVEVYENARSSNLSTANKGRFAYTVESLYQIKTKGLDADGKYWWHITWFNSAVSISVSAVVVFWAAVIVIVISIIVAVILIAMFIGSLGN